MLGPWTAAVADSADWLRAQTGAERVAVIGIGLGGLVAAHAAGTGAAIDDLVLWAVNARGKRLLRELRAFASLNSDLDPEDQPDDGEDEPQAELPPPQDDGGLAVGGFLIADATVAELEALDLDADPFDAPEGRRALLLGRDGILPDKRLTERLERAGLAVSAADGDGYGSMMNHPQQAQPPLAAFAAVASWIAEAEAPASTPSPAPGIAETFDVNHGGARIVETPLSFPVESGDLYGVLARCEDVPDAGFTAVLLNAGALRRIGPGRLWVELSRDWARRGIPTLRLDLEGLGDADGGICPYEDTGDLYVDRLVDQTLAVTDQLAERGLPPRFILGGLCSGAYWAFHGALRDPRVEVALLLNPRALYFDNRLDEVRTARRAREVTKAGAWKKVASGSVTPARAARILRAAATAPLHARADKRTHQDRRQKVDAALDTLDETGKRILFLFGENEPLYDEMLADGQIERLERAPGMHLERIPGRDHSFRPLSSQRNVTAVLDRVIVAELNR
jgi:pimeloyl-ACP methyl ester carboxylesterase